MRKSVNTVVVSVLVLIIVSGTYFIYGHLSGKHSDNSVLHKFAEKFTGKKNVCQENIEMLQAAADKYKSDKGSYPGEIEALVGKYVKAIPKCPGGNGYSIDSQGEVFEDSEKR